MKFTKKIGDARDGWALSVLFRLDPHRVLAGLFWYHDISTQYLKSKSIKDFVQTTMSSREAYRLWYAHTMSQKYMRTLMVSLHVPFLGIVFEITRFRVLTPMDKNYN